MKFRTTLKGGCHNFEYFDQKSSWHWDWWEKDYQLFFGVQKSQKKLFIIF